MTPGAMVDVIVPAFNAGRFVGETLESIRAQEMERWQCLVVDDGSTDDTADVVAKHAAVDDRIMLVRQENSGSSASCNRGLPDPRLRAPYVSFLHADDLWLPSTLRVLMAALEASPAAVAAHGVADFIDEVGRPLQPGEFAAASRQRLGFDGRRIVAWPATAPTTFECLASYSRVTPPAVVLSRRAVVDQVGPWDSQLDGCEDGDFWIRLARFGDFAYLPDVVVYYRRHSGNQSNNFAHEERTSRLLRYKLHNSPDNTAAQRTAMRRLYKAWVLYRYQLNVRGARASVAKGDWREAVALAARGGYNLVRWVRGFPTRNG